MSTNEKSRATTIGPPTVMMLRPPKTETPPRKGTSRVTTGIKSGLERTALSRIQNEGDSLAKVGAKGYRGRKTKANRKRRGRKSNKRR